MMKKVLLLIFLLLVSTTVTFSQTAFKSGSLVILRVGDGSVALNDTALPVFIDEYSTTGKLIRSIPLPTTGDTKGNKTLTLSGNTSYEGLLSLAQDGEKLSFVGYDAPLGTPKVNTTSNDRVVGIIDESGKINTTTAVPVFSQKAAIAAVTDRNNIWISGVSPNLYHTTIGATAATSIYSKSIRGLGIFNQQLYASQSSLKGLSPVIQIGMGLPVTIKQVVKTLPGMPVNSPLASGRQFFFADLDANIPGNDVLYVANDAKTDGITKYSLVNGAWVSNGTITGSYIGLTAVVSGFNITLYVVKYGGTMSKVYVINDDTGYNGAISGLIPKPLVNAPAKTMFRGIALAPQTSSKK